METTPNSWRRGAGSETQAQMAAPQNGSSLRIPLYVQVREKLREELAHLEAGTMIPTEAVLERQFGVSRITIRKAIDDLVGDGLLIRRQGRGTFREVPKLVHELNNITSWTEQMNALGYSPRTVAREVAEINPPRKIVNLLELSPGEKVIQIRRTRLANDEPITLMVNYVPSKLVPGILEADCGLESLYEFLKVRYQLSPSEAVDNVETRAASETESEKLQIEPWSPVLVVTRTARLDDGRPLEVCVAVSRGDRYEYRVRLHNRAPVSGV